eukprot:3723796-Rhodomonas_salina.1
MRVSTCAAHVPHDTHTRYARACQIRTPDTHTTDTRTPDTHTKQKGKPGPGPRQQASYRGKRCSEHVAGAAHPPAGHGRGGT